jgi:hypothetical protein
LFLTGPKRGQIYFYDADMGTTQKNDVFPQVADSFLSFLSSLDCEDKVIFVPSSLPYSHSPSLPPLFHLSPPLTLLSTSPALIANQYFFKVIMFALLQMGPGKPPSPLPLHAIFFLSSLPLPLVHSHCFKFKIFS